MRQWIFVAAFVLGGVTLARLDSRLDGGRTVPPTRGVDEPQHRPPPQPDLGLPPSSVGGAGEAGTGEQLAPGQPDQATLLLEQARPQLQSNPNGAASALEQAARQMEENRTEVTGKARVQLQQGSLELSRLAHDLRGGTLHSQAQANATFARGFNAMAAYHRARAQGHWDRRDPQRTGRELEASASDLQRAAQLTGQGAEDAARGGLEDTRRVAAKLDQGTGIVPAEVDRSLGNLEGLIGHIDQQLQQQGGGSGRAPSQ